MYIVSYSQLNCQLVLPWSTLALSGYNIYKECKIKKKKPCWYEENDKVTWSNPILWGTNLVHHLLRDIESGYSTDNKFTLQACVLRL